MAKTASKKGSSASTKAARPAKGPALKSKSAKLAAPVVKRPAAKQPVKKSAASKPVAKSAAPAPKAKARAEAKPARAEGRAPAAEARQQRPASANNGGGAIPAPVPTNDKPRKNQAGLSPKELEHFRDLLLAKRREILGDMSSMEREALRSSGGSNLSTLPIHMADMGTDNYEQEFTLGLVETERKLLREINNALAKIQNGTYGLCEGTSEPINKARLEVQPWARYSIEYAKRMERAGR